MLLFAEAKRGEVIGFLWGCGTEFARAIEYVEPEDPLAWVASGRVGLALHVLERLTKRVNRPDLQRRGERRRGVGTKRHESGPCRLGPS